ncbi:response regulator [Alteromonas gilva]|uniref:Response regulator transcription factor n=1 Tax=Alteromonas gilva TaxID=2987522 RepID=A0ABT5L6B8_9ALTE|nr:response regulator transcription factor [Alteromonas gilva]MDC8831954.1 response regulator transcription factor [Alteromonas gilva]
MIRVLVVDDQQLLRQGLCSLLALSDEIEVVGQANDGVEAQQWLQRHPDAVDVMLLDIRMPRMTGIELLNTLKQANALIATIMLTTFDDHESLMGALSAGARGYLLKDVSLETLVAGIQAVHAGESLIQPAITTTLLNSLQGLATASDEPDLTEPLSEKEKEILRLMASGCSNKEIAAALYKSEGTVKNQVSNILAKLGARDRTRAVLRAVELGILG